MNEKEFLAAIHKSGSGEVITPGNKWAIVCRLLWHRWRWGWNYDTRVCRTCREEQWW